MYSLTTPIPGFLLRAALIVIVVSIVIGMFYPIEEVWYWHLTSKPTTWNCQKFQVKAATSWMAGSPANCKMGVNMRKPPLTLFGSLDFRGSVVFTEDAQMTNNIFPERFEQAFRFVTDIPPGVQLTYIGDYQQALGSCAIAKTPRQMVALWCRNSQKHLVTTYRGQATYLQEILTMLR